MFKPRPCGCKGIRTCLVCEADFGIQKVNSGLENDENLIKNCLEFCHLCGDRAWPAQDVWKDHPNHSSSVSSESSSSIFKDGYPFPGVLLVPDFLTPEEEEELSKGCDGLTWDLSQSGRRKQNFGPKTNFKKKKISGKSFCGFPSFSRKFQDKLRSLPELQNFITIEQCAIEYRPETGSCIDPHIDDCWVWGERVISISLLSLSVLTMTKYEGNSQKYNLGYHFHEKSKCKYKDDNQEDKPKPPQLETSSHPIVRILMPPRSLLVLTGEARYCWEHSILRRDIKSRRICMAYREFTPEYLPKGSQYEEVGKDIIQKAENYFDEIDA